MTTRKRRGRGEASIFQRANGQWCGAVSLGYGGDGRRIRRTIYGKSKSDVAEQVRKLQSEHDAGQPVVRDMVTVGEYLQNWLAVAKKGTGAATFARYQQIVEQYLTPALGGIRLVSLQPVHVQNAYGKLVRETPNGKVAASDNTTRAAGTVLGIALRAAVRLKLIPSNPAADVDKPKKYEREMQFLTPAQVKTFPAAARSGSNFALFAMAVGSGCRLGELLALQWSDFDFDKGTVSVKRSVSQVGTEFIVKEPKSKSGRLTITLPPFVLAAVRARRRDAMKDGLILRPVFCTSRRTYCNKSNVRREFIAIVKKANAQGEPLPTGLRVHDLRHSHASCLISDGQSVKAVSKRLGHSDITITLKTYAHMLPDDDMKLAASAAMLFG